MSSALFWILMALLMIVFISSLVDILNARFKNPDHKMYWLVALFFTTGAAGVVYWLVRSRFVIPASNSQP